MTPTRIYSNDLWRMCLLPAVVFFLLSFSAQSQAPRTGLPSAQDPSPNDRNKDNKDKDDTGDYGSPENELRAKAILKEEKKRYDENVARAREVSELAEQVCENYEARKAFGSDDEKRLERLEKLTKRIRNEAGGSDSDSDVEVKDLGGAMQDILKKVADTAVELKKLVEKTPRQVVSAAVIDQANKLVGLVRHVRSNP